MFDASKPANPNPAFQRQKARLVWDDNGSQKEWLLEKAETTIGRANENNIVISDTQSSRYHAVVVLKPDGYTLLDLDSSNGTFVNGERVKEKNLNHGDHVRVGQIDFRFEMLTPQEPSPPGVKTLGRIIFDEQGMKKIQSVGTGLSLGRSMENNVILRDLGASRFHCRILPEAAGFAIFDLDSTNGTFVNEDKVVGRRPLQNGDRIRIGKLEIQFETVVQDGTPTVSLDVLEEAPTLAKTPEDVEKLAAAAIEFPILQKPKPISIGTEVVIDIKDVIKDYESPSGTVRILKSVSLQVNAGTFVGVRGPSGSGKSTLLNMITGIDRPTSGEVIITGQSLLKLSENKMSRWRGEHIGVIFQFFQLLPTLTIVENIMLPMDFCRKWKHKERQERAMSLLELVGLAEHAHKLPSMLSGGQQQRAAIARAMANDPPLIVADEPTGNLDSKTADKIFTLFMGMVEHGTTFLMVTHDSELAKRIPRVVQVLDGELTEV